jgi:transketolase
MAIAEAHLAAKFNRPGYPVLDHYTYVVASDGDLMEGVASEACSLAGHLGLGKLIVLYDDNHISIDGPTDLAFTENRMGRFKAYGWHTQEVSDGNDTGAIARALEEARGEGGRPSIIAVRTHIGFGSPNKQDTADAHGSPLGEDEVRLTKENLGWPSDQTFFVPDEVRDHFHQLSISGKNEEKQWNTLFSEYKKEHPDLAAMWKQMWRTELPEGWQKSLPDLSGQSMATRSASGKVINALAPALPRLLGGSADLAPSNNTLIASEGTFSREDREGRNFHFGVREHGMAAVANGMSLHGALHPYVATFLHPSAH